MEGRNCERDSKRVKAVKGKGGMEREGWRERDTKRVRSQDIKRKG